MAEGSGVGPRRHNRVNWVALRTLRQLPKVVGENSAGEPIVDVRSVRLVLREGASHFSRVTTCSKCGREVPGAPVLSPADLDQPPHPVICKDCVRNAAPVLRAPAATRAAPDARRTADAARPPDDDRMAVLERRIAELAKLVEGQRAEVEAAVERRLENTRTELRAFAAKELARAQEDVDRMMKGVVERVGRAEAGADAGDVQAVEATLSGSLERLSQRVDDQRAELVAELDARLAELRLAIGDQGRRPATVETQERLDAIEARLGELQRRLDEAPSIDVAEGPSPRHLERIEVRAQELEARLEAGLTGLHAQVASDHPRIETLETQLRGLQSVADKQAARLEARVEKRLAAMAEQVAPERGRLDGLESRLSELERSLDARAAMLAQQLDARLHEQASERQRLDALEIRLVAEAARIDSELDRLGAEAAPDGGRLDGLEHRLGALEASLEEARETAVRDAGQLAERLDRQAERARRAPEPDGRLEALEQQLADAIERFSSLVESQRQDFQEELRTGLAEARMAMAADQRGGGRLKKLEDAAAQQDARLAELTELQTALDTGLGELRSQIEQVREIATRAADTETRVMTTVPVPAPPAIEPERGRRGKKGVDALAGLTATVQGLLDERRVLRAELATLQNEAQTAVRASARASAQSMAVAPLRHDVSALREEVAAQSQEIAALAERVETLQKAMTPGAPAKSPTKPTKTTKAMKATKVAKPVVKSKRSTKKA